MASSMIAMVAHAAHAAHDSDDDRKHSLRRRRQSKSRSRSTSKGQPGQDIISPQQVDELMEKYKDCEFFDPEISPQRTVFVYMYVKVVLLS